MRHDPRRGRRRVEPGRLRAAARAAGCQLRRGRGRRAAAVHRRRRPVHDRAGDPAAGVRGRGRPAPALAGLHRAARRLHPVPGGRRPAAAAGAGRCRGDRPLLRSVGATCSTSTSSRRWPSASWSPPRSATPPSGRTWTAGGRARSGCRGRHRGAGPPSGRPSASSASTSRSAHRRALDLLRAYAYGAGRTVDDVAADLLSGRLRRDGPARTPADRSAGERRPGSRPAASSAARTARASSTAPGVSPCTHTDSTGDQQRACRPPRRRRRRRPSGRRARPPPPGRAPGRRARGAGTSVPAGGVAAVGEALARPCAGPPPPPSRSSAEPGSPSTGSGRSNAATASHHRPRLRLVVDDGVVERAVRLDVGDPAAGGSGDPVERGQLVEHVVGQLGRFDVDEPAAEAGQVAVGHLGADGDPARGGPRAHPAHRRPGRPRGSRRRRSRWSRRRAARRRRPSRQTPKPSPRSALRSMTRRPAVLTGAVSHPLETTCRLADMSTMRVRFQTFRMRPWGVASDVRRRGERPVPTPGLAAPALLEALPDVVVVADDEGRIVYANPAVRLTARPRPGRPARTTPDRADAGAVPAGARRRLRPLPRDGHRRALRDDHAAPGAARGRVRGRRRAHPVAARPAPTDAASGRRGRRGAPRRQHHRPAGAPAGGEPLPDRHAPGHRGADRGAGRRRRPSSGCCRRCAPSWTGTPPRSGSREPRRSPLAHAGTWTPPGAAVPALQADTRVRTFVRGEGLPGRAWQRRAPVVVDDLWAEPASCARRPPAPTTLRTAVAFPILRGDTLLGVCELFSRERRPVPAELVDVLASAGRQIGQFLGPAAGGVRAAGARRHAAAEPAAVAPAGDPGHPAGRALPRRAAVRPGRRRHLRRAAAGRRPLDGADRRRLRHRRRGGRGHRAHPAHRPGGGGVRDGPADVLCAVNTALLHEQYAARCGSSPPAAWCSSPREGGHRAGSIVAGHPLPLLRTDGRQCSRDRGPRPPARASTPTSRYAETTVELAAGRDAACSTPTASPRPATTPASSSARRGWPTCSPR